MLEKLSIVWNGRAIFFSLFCWQYFKTTLNSHDVEAGESKSWKTTTSFARRTLHN